MKICLINNLYKPYSRGGADRVADLMRRGLEGSGHSVFAVSTRPLFDRRQIPGGDHYLGSLFPYLGRMPTWLRLAYHIWDLAGPIGYLRLRRMLKKERPDLVITHNLKGIGLPAAALIRRMGFRHAHFLHDIQLLHPSGLMMSGGEKKADSFFAAVYARACRLVISSPQIVISPSRWLMSEHEKRGFFRKSRKEILPNPAPAPVADPEKGGAAGGFRYLYVGEIEEHKGVFLLMEAFKRIAEIDRTASLEIIGKGSAQDRLASSDRIRISGWRSPEEVRAAMQGADCLIVPSLCYENSPTVIYEAAACGLFMIASRLGGIPELIDDLGGELFEPGNTDDLAEKMLGAIKKPEELKAVGLRAKERIKSYGLEAYIERLEKIIF